MNYFYKQEFNEIINYWKNKLQTQKNITWINLIDAIKIMNENLEIALNKYKEQQKQSIVLSKNEYIWKAP